MMQYYYNKNVNVFKTHFCIVRQCHMSTQKSFSYADLEIKKSFL